MLKGKRILLAVTGSIAAYKSAMLVRLLVKEGAEVRVIMTEMAKQFITPLTMATLSRNPILVEFYNPENGDWNSHVSLGLWADLFLVAPASANTIAKMANGVADNLLLTTYLSAKCPVAVAPAMDLDMFRHPATQGNLEILRSRGVTVIEPASGELASGLEGKGRMEEPERIVPWIERILLADSGFAGKKVLVTSGPTQEPIDPVRYITNRSTGKMGFQLARAFAAKGADVMLVSGPVSIGLEYPGVKVKHVMTASEMYDAVVAEVKDADVAVFCAAVADYSPASVSERKIKRTADSMSLELVPNRDIAAEVGKIKPAGCVTVGFALETDNAESNAVSKMKRKNLDMVVLNSLEDKGAGFACDTNKVTIFTSGGSVETGSLKTKAEVAMDIVENVEKLLKCSENLQ